MKEPRTKRHRRIFSPPQRSFRIQAFSPPKVSFRPLRISRFPRELRPLKTFVQLPPIFPILRVFLPLRFCPTFLLPFSVLREKAFPRSVRKPAFSRRFSPRFPLRKRQAPLPRETARTRGSAVREFPQPSFRLPSPPRERIFRVRKPPMLRRAPLLPVREGRLFPIYRLPTRKVFSKFPPGSFLWKRYVFAAVPVAFLRAIPLLFPHFRIFLP